MLSKILIKNNNDSTNQFIGLVREGLTFDKIKSFKRLIKRGIIIILLSLVLLIVGIVERDIISIIGGSIMCLLIWIMAYRWVNSYHSNLFKFIPSDAFWLENLIDKIYENKNFDNHFLNITNSKVTFKVDFDLFVDIKIDLIQANIVDQIENLFRIISCTCPECSPYNEYYTILMGVCHIRKDNNMFKMTYSNSHITSKIQNFHRLFSIDKHEKLNSLDDRKYDLPKMEIPTFDSEWDEKKYDDVRLYSRDGYQLLSNTKDYYFVSHIWELPDNPDPLNQTFLCSYYRYSHFFLDFLSLPQKIYDHNSETHRSIFKKGLMKMYDLQKASKTVKIVPEWGLDEYDHRGWCVAEQTFLGDTKMMELLHKYTVLYGFEESLKKLRIHLSDMSDADAIKRYFLGLKGGGDFVFKDVSKGVYSHHFESDFIYSVYPFDNLRTREKEQLIKAVKNNEINQKTIIKVFLQDFYDLNDRPYKFTKSRLYKSHKRRVTNEELEILKYLSKKTSRYKRAKKPINLKHRSRLLDKILNNYKKHKLDIDMNDSNILFKCCWVVIDWVFIIRDVLYQLPERLY